MSDDQLLHEFTRLTGKTVLACKHCGKREYSLDRFVTAIRTRCLKPSSGGLHKDMPIPKTCDAQQAKNKASAKVNNYYYSRIRKAITDEDKMALKEEHKAALQTNNN